MTKARTLADFISDGSPLADGTISVSEVSGAAPLASPTFTGTVTVPDLTSTGNITFGDNDKAIFGFGSDLQIYHNGSNSYLDEVGTGNLFVRANNLRLSNADNSQYYLIADNSGFVKLNYAGATKLATTSTGVEITGDVGADTATIAGTVTATSVSLNALVPTNAFATLVLNNAVGIANDPVAIDTWLETTASDGYKYGDMDKNGSIGAYDGSLIVQIAGGVASEAVTSRWYDIVVPSLVQQSWYADLVADGTLTGGGAFSGPLTGNVTGELDLTAIAETITDTAVDVFVYDTSKDSDGGAWRKRTQGTSWYNETLNTATRGSRKEFPAVAVIVAESDTVTIYDGDDPDLPMWMVFNGTSSSRMTPEGQATSVFALNAQVSVGCGGAGYDLNVVRFIDDTAHQYTTYTVAKLWGGNIEQRNEFLGYYDTTALPNIIDRKINDVAMTVLPNAPIDAATGLPVPTIAVATDGGWSQISDDGNVYDFAFSTNPKVTNISFKNDTTIAWNGDSSDFIFDRGYFEHPLLTANKTSQAVTSFTEGVASYEYGAATTSRYPVPIADAGDGNNHSISNTIGNRNGLSLYDALLENRVTSTGSNGMVAYVASDYATGWQNGAIKLATLSDTDDTDVTGSELVTNGTFDSDTSGWTALSSATLSVDTNRLKMTNSGTTIGGAYQAISVTVGKKYVIDVGLHDYLTTNGIYYKVGNSPAGTEYVNTGNSPSGYTHTITPTASTIYLTFQTNNNISGAASAVDNISVRLAEEDRSVNGNGLQVFGTVTKNPVATGADLVAYSGWSTSNYMQQPYNSDLDLGTGDFCLMGWCTPEGSGSRYIFDGRDAESGGNGFILYRASNGGFQLTTYDAGAGTGVLTNTQTYLNSTQWTFVTAIRRNGVLEIYLNGKLDNTNNGTVRDVDGSSRKSTFGISFPLHSYHVWPGSLALWRISATAPSPEQIAKMYRDEALLFQENAQATLYGSSDAVTALAYDDTTELLHVGTSAGRSVFQGLRRVDNTTDAVGAAISASNGLVAED